MTTTSAKVWACIGWAWLLAAVFDIAMRSGRDVVVTDLAIVLLCVATSAILSRFDRLKDA